MLLVTLDFLCFILIVLLSILYIYPSQLENIKLHLHTVDYLICYQLTVY